MQTLNAIAYLTMLFSSYQRLALQTCVFCFCLSVLFSQVLAVNDDAPLAEKRARGRDPARSRVLVRRMGGDVALDIQRQVPLSSREKSPKEKSVTKSRHAPPAPESTKASEGGYDAL